MSYEELKSELTKVVEDYYQRGMVTNDIRAAIRAVDLRCEQLGAIELVEISRSMASPPRVNPDDCKTSRF